MRGIARYLAALLAVLCLLAAALAGLFCCVTTEAFAREVNGTAAVQAMQQQRIRETAQALTERWQLSDELLLSLAEDAAQAHGRSVACWWGALWSDPEADTALPVWLDSQAENALVAQIRADEGFIAATDEDQRRAIARDDVAYTLDEAVCEAVMPLRRGLAEMALSLLAEVVLLPLIRQAALIGAGALAAAALVLLILAHRASGSILAATGISMAMLTVPVLLADVPQMLQQLSSIARMQGENALAFMGILWYGAAAVLMLAGLLILGAKKLVRRDAA